MVELSDRHGITGDREGEVTRPDIRIKYGKKYNISVRCQSNHVGELKIPVVVFFYHDALSEIVEDEKTEMMMVQSIMVVELLVRTQTKSNVPKEKVSMTMGRRCTEESLKKGVKDGLHSQPVRGGEQSHGWQCTLCTLVNHVDVSACGRCGNTWFKWQTGSQSQGVRQSKSDLSIRKVSMATGRRRRKRGKKAKGAEVGKLLEGFGEKEASAAKEETRRKDSVPDLRKKASISAGESLIHEKLGLGVQSGWECSFCSSHNTEDASVCGVCNNSIPNLLWFQWAAE